MTLYFIATKRVSHVGQYDRVDDFVAFNLSGDKPPVVQFLGGEFHSSAIFKCFNPLIVWHFSVPPQANHRRRVSFCFGSRTRRSERGIVWPMTLRKMRSIGVSERVLRRIRPS